MCIRDRGYEHLQLANPALTLSLVVQPEVLRQLAGVKGGKGRGLLGRFLYSLPATNLGRRSNTQPHAMDSGIEHRYAAIVSAMLAQPLGDKARVLSIDGTARVEWAEFADAIEHRLREDGDLRLLAGWASKAAGAVARIAGCLHAAEHAHSTPDGAPIAPETVKAAVEIVDYFVQHALESFTKPTKPGLVREFCEFCGRLWGAKNRRATPYRLRRCIGYGTRCHGYGTSPGGGGRRLPPLPPPLRKGNSVTFRSYSGEQPFSKGNGSNGVTDTKSRNPAPTAEGYGVTDTQPPQAEGEDAATDEPPPSDPSFADEEESTLPPPEVLEV